MKLHELIPTVLIKEAARGDQALKLMKSIQNRYFNSLAKIDGRPANHFPASDFLADVTLAHDPIDVSKSVNEFKEFKHGPWQQFLAKAMKNWRSGAYENLPTVGSGVVPGVKPRVPFDRLK